MLRTIILLLAAAVSLSASTIQASCMVEQVGGQIQASSGTSCNASLSYINGTSATAHASGATGFMSVSAFASAYNPAPSPCGACPFAMVADSNVFVSESYSVTTSGPQRSGYVHVSATGFGGSVTTPWCTFFCVAPVTLGSEGYTISLSAYEDSNTNPFAPATASLALSFYEADGVTPVQYQASGELQSALVAANPEPSTLSFVVAAGAFLLLNSASRKRRSAALQRS